MIYGSCHKTEINQDDSITFFSLKEFKTSGSGFAIDETSVMPGNEILISYDDLISYDAQTHTFAIPKALAEKINGNRLQSDYYQKPFALVIGKDIIHTGYFWSLLSSTACDWITAYSLGDQLIF